MDKKACIVWLVIMEDDEKRPRWFPYSATGRKVDFREVLIGSQWYQRLADAKKNLVTGLLGSKGIRATAQPWLYMLWEQADTRTRGKNRFRE